MTSQAEALQRPLESKTDTHWDGKITPVAFDNGKETTGYCWFLIGNGPMNLIGGEVIVLPERATVAFVDRRYTDPFFYSNPDDLLGILEKYGWGEPPHFDEVCGSIKMYEEMKTRGMSTDQGLAGIVEGWRQLDTRNTPGQS